MADGLEITFEGMDKFNSNMMTLSGPTAELVARRAMRAGGRVIQAAITEAAPVRPDLPSGTALPPGALKSDIELHVVKERDGSISAIIAPGKQTSHQARWVEYGHKLVRGGRLTNWGKPGKGQEVGFVEAHPFIRPAFEASEAAALAAAEESVAVEITKEAQRLGFA
jgi:HK97 gp10 family phage protein